MSSSSSMINVMRLVALGTVCAFSLIVLGVSAHMIFVTEQVGTYFTFNAFSVAISLLTLLAFPPLLIIGFMRSGAIVTSIIVEIGVLGLFWVFWLATASYTADQLFFLPTDCNFEYNVNGYIISCHEPQAVNAFSWLNWLILTAYWPFLLVMAIVQQNRGNPVWTKSVNEVNMFAPSVVASTGVVYTTQPQQPVMYAAQPVQQPMQHQPQYPPGTPGATYSPVPATGGYLPPQPHYAPTPPPQQPQQYPPVGGGYPQV